MLPTRVVKRTGELADFDEDRIRTAILKAVAASGPNEIAAESVDGIVGGVTNEIKGRFREFFPNVENIQDLVEKHLVLGGHYEIAKSYILYRDERSKVRQQARKRAIEDARLGKLTVAKRDGRTVLFSAKKIEESILHAANGLSGDIETDRLIREVINNVYDGIPTVQIEQALVLATAAFIERDPAYDYLAAVLLLQCLYKEVAGRSLLDSELDAAYRKAFKDTVRSGLRSGQLDKRLGNFDLDLLATSLRPERDKLFRYLGIQTLYDRYLLRESGRTNDTYVRICCEHGHCIWAPFEELAETNDGISTPEDARTGETYWAKCPTCPSVAGTIMDLAR